VTVIDVGLKNVFNTDNHQGVIEVLVEVMGVMDSTLNTGASRDPVGCPRRPVLDEWPRREALCVTYSDESAEPEGTHRWTPLRGGCLRRIPDPCALMANTGRSKDFHVRVWR